MSEATSPVIITRRQLDGWAIVVRQLLAERNRIVRAICPNCGPNHILENGRVWGLCGLQRLMREHEPTHIPEEDVKVMIQSLDPGQDGGTPSGAGR